MTPLEITAIVWLVGAALSFITLGVEAVLNPRSAADIELVGVLILLVLAPVMGLVSIGVLIGHTTKGRR